MKKSPQSVTDFYDSGWDQWSDMKHYGPMSRHVRRLCGRILEGLDFDSMLDAGCGEGSFLRHVRNTRPELKLAGVDISRNAIERAKKTLPGCDLNVLNLEDAVPDERYDVVTSIEVIEHVPDDVRLMKNIRKITKKYFLLCTLTGRMRPQEKEVGHLRNYSEAELIGKLRSAGFQIANVQKWGFPFYSPLYREALEHVPQGLATGEFGWPKKIISEALYHLLFITVRNKGDVIIILARPGSPSL
jgi:ubiquinone/menaquinone biosynthesis C-methylase UbiE